MRLQVITAAAAASAGVLLGAAGVARAEVRSWDNGSGDLRWNTSLNWNPDGVPTATTDVALQAGMTAGTNILVTGLGLGAVMNTLTIGTLNPFTLSQDGTTTVQTIAGGGTNLIRQDPFGVEGNHTINWRLRVNTHSTWAVNGSGTLYVQELSQLSSGTNFTKNGNGFLYLGFSGLTGTLAVNNGSMRIDDYRFTTATIAAGRELQLGFHDVNSLPSVTMTGTAASAATLRTLAGGHLWQFTLAGDNQSVIVDGATLTLVNGISDGGAGRSWAKNGAAQLTLTGIGAYSGTTFVNAGTLRAERSDALGTGPVVVAPGATLDVTASGTVSNAISLAGTLAGTNASLAGPITLAGNAVLNAGGFNPAVISGAVSDGANSFNLTKSDFSTAVLSNGANAFDSLTVAQGTLRMTASQSGIGSILVQSFAALDLQNDVTVASPLQLNGGALTSSSGSNAYSGPVTLLADSTAGGTGTLTLAGNVLGNFTLTKVGTGTLAFGNTINGFTGLNVSAGVVSLASNGQIQGTSVTVGNAGTLRLDGSTAVFVRPLTLNGGLLVNPSGTNTWSGPVTLGTGGGHVSAPAGLLSITGNILGSQTLFKESAGEVVLAGTNAHGNTQVNAGVLTVQSPGALPAGTTTTVASGATLQLRDLGFSATATTAALRLNGQGAGGRGTLHASGELNIFAGPVTMVTASTIGVAAGSVLALTNTIADDATSLPLVKVGPGSLALVGSNTYRGGTIVNGGAVGISADAALGDAAGAVTLNNGGRLLISDAPVTTGRTFNLNTGSLQVAAEAQLSYNGAVVSGGFLRGPGVHHQPGGPAAASSFSGVTALPGTVFQQDGVLLLNNFTNSGAFTNGAALTWDGGYNTAAGQLFVNSTLDTSFFENNGSITIGNGATLGNSGNDLVSGGGSRITVNAGGTLQLNETNLNLHGAVAVSNGTIAGGTTNVHFGSLLAGTGNFGTVVLHPGGAFTPGVSLSNMPAPAPVGNATIVPLDANQSTAAPVLFVADTTARVTASDQVLTFTAPLTGPGKTLTKTDAGTFAVAGLRAGGLNVQAGAVRVLPNGGPAGLTVLGAVTVAGGARFDLTDNDLLVDYTGASVEAAIRQLVKNGRASGTGITSTPGTPDDDKVLAVADNVHLNRTAWLGVPIDTSTVIGKYTYFGDANLDGKVTGDDYLNVDANLGTGDSWLEGDFNMSGVTTGDDYLAIDANLGKGTANPLAFAQLKEEMVALHAAMFGEEYLVKLAQAESERFGASALPEPGTISLIGLAAVGLVRRGRSS